MGEPKENIAIAAAFLSGFYTLQTLNFCWTASFPTLLKFGISPSKIGCFMGEAGASMNYWVSWGILLAYGLSFCGWTGGVAFIAPGISTVIYILAFAYTWYVKRFNWWKALLLFIFVLGPPIGALFFIGYTDYKNKDETDKDKQIGKFVCPIVSCFTTVCTFITHCIIFYVVVFGHGYEGVRKLYFWLCTSALAYQFDSSTTVKVAGGQVAWLFFAMEVSYFIIPFIHLCCNRSHKALGVRDLNFFTVFWHLFSVCTTTGMAVELWIVSVYLNWDGYQSTKADQEWNKPLIRCLSPFFMGIIGMGSIFWLFPAVWPFMVCHYAHFRFVMLFSAVLSSPATLIPLVLNDGDKIGITDVKLYTKFDIWSIYEFKGGCGYHFVWLILVVIFILFWINMCCIHYPRCFVARSVLHSRWAVVCGSLFFFLTSFFKAIGLDGCFANAIGASFNCIGFAISGANISGTVSIVNGANVKITGFNIGLDGTTSSIKKITGTFAKRTIGGSVALHGSNKPTIVLHGFVSTVSTLELSDPTTASGQFTGSSNTITLSPGTLDLGFSNKPGGDNASIIVSLAKVEIKGLELDTTSNPLTVNATTVGKIDLTLVFLHPVMGTGTSTRTFTLNSQTLNTCACSVKLYETSGETKIAGVNPTITAGQFDASSATTVTIDTSTNEVTLGQLNFQSGKALTITLANGTVANGTGTVKTSGNQVKVVLYGYTAKAEEVQSDAVTATSVPSNIKLGEDNENALKLYTDQSNPQNLNLNVSESVADEGQDKANTFISSDAGNFLTKMEITLPLASSSGLKLDGFLVENKTTMTLDFSPGIPGNSDNTGFSVTNTNVAEAKSKFSFPDTMDFAHGPAYGTVSFNFSLFHLTASIFTSQAYSVGVASFKCGVDSGCLWPTQGIGGLRSYWWWSYYALKNGNRRFWSLADVDIISVIS